MSLSDRDLQRAEGAVRLVLCGSERGTRIMDVFQQSPMRIMFPGRRGAPVEEVVLVNTGGGVAGGDRLESVVKVLPQACAVVTTQTPERVYRALSEPARLATRLKVSSAAKLAWLPQETIVFNGARMQRRTEMDLHSGAQLLALEWLVFGRAACGEEVVSGQITESWRVRKDGRLIWADGFRVTDEIFPFLRKPALLGDFKTIATLIYFGPDLDRHQQRIRDLASSMTCRCVATAVAGLLIVRFAAKTAGELREGLRAVLHDFDFGAAAGAGPFRVPKMWSC